MAQTPAHDTDPAAPPYVPPRRRTLEAFAGLALFVGGCLAGAGILLSAQAVSRPSATLVPSPVATSVATQAASQGASQVTEPAMEPLVTLPAVTRPDTLTPTDLADGYAVGDSRARVTVDVWADFQCPYCRLFTLSVEPQIVATYVETRQARLVFHDLPFLGEESRWAAVAARAAKDQGKFWPYHDCLFANQLAENSGAFTPARLRQIAVLAGLDMASYDQSMQLDRARATYAALESGAQQGAGALGINSTPTVVVDGKKLAKADWATVKAAVDASLGPVPAASSATPRPSAS